MSTPFTGLLHAWTQLEIAAQYCDVFVNDGHKVVGKSGARTRPKRKAISGATLPAIP